MTANGKCQPKLQLLINRRRFIQIAACSAIGTCFAKEELPHGLIEIVGGEFLMGDILEDKIKIWRGRIPETPLVKVSVDDFYLARYETTVGEFKKFIKDKNYITSTQRNEKKPEKKHLLPWEKLQFPQEDNHPVVKVSWEDAIEYCNWLSEKDSLPKAYDFSRKSLLDKNGKKTNDIRDVVGYRLPTEAEWEYAARERGKNVRFGNGKNIAKYTEINFKADELSEAHPPMSKIGKHVNKTTKVGSFVPNSLGLYDMSGNAWEWCLDEAVDFAKGYVSKVNPENHAIRGGNYMDGPDYCRVATRYNFWAHAPCEVSGFRIARSKVKSFKL